MLRVPSVVCSKLLCRTFTIALLVLALGVAMAFSTVGSSRPQQGPRNPEFEQYIEDLRFGGRPTDMTSDGHTLGFIPPPVDQSHLRDRESEAGGSRPITGHPAVYDLRSSGLGGTAEVTAVHDQGGCGSCWTFGTLASLESWLLKVEGVTWDLSENNLKECHGFDFGPCDGGNAYMTTAYLARRDGPIEETDDPYSDFVTGCATGLDVPLYLRETAMPASVDRIKTLLQSHGAMATSFYWNAAYYDAGTTTYYYDGPLGTNHCVALVGWDDARTTAAPGVGAWILKNSWGTGWGEGGYFYLSYEDTHAADYAHLLYDAHAADDTMVHEYDPLGYVTDLGYGDADDWAANVFTATAPGDLESVGFYTTDVDVDYHIYVKRGGPDGTVAYDQGGWATQTDAGHHTVDLSTPVSLSSGEEFTVVIRFLGNVAYEWVVAVEYALGIPEIPWDYSMDATANPGESYMSDSGTPASWWDVTNWDPTANVCIKAIVRNEPPPALVTDFDATDGEDAQSTLSWTNPADGDLAQVVVQRTTGGYPTSHTDGTTVYADGAPTPGAAVTGQVDSPLVNGTTYYYAVFAEDDEVQWNDTVTPGSNADMGTPTEPGAVAPVGYWQFELASGTTAADSSTYGNDGTILGAIRVIDGSADGSNALLFDGVNDYVSVPADGSLDITGSFTIEAWVKLNEKDWHCLVERGVSGNRYGLWYNGTENRLYVISAGQAGPQSASSATVVIEDGTWHHVAGVYESGVGARFYVDGIQVATATDGTNDSATTSGELRIGRSTAFGKWYADGVVDEVLVHAEALSEGELNLLSPPLPLLPGPQRVDTPSARIRPNPFTSSTTVEVLGADVARCRFYVWDLAGNLLVDTGWETGASIVWSGTADDGRKLSAGAYLCRVLAETSADAPLSFAVQKVFVLP